MRLLQMELDTVQGALAERGDDESVSAQALGERLDNLQTRLENLPAEVAELCPELPDAATVTTQCETAPAVQRVMVSGDKLVVGEVERVWLEPPGATLVARIDTSTELSIVHAQDLVEFERDGKKWVRFNLSLDEELISVESAIDRYVRIPVDNARRPSISLRVQLGDVRETVEFVLSSLSALPEQIVLGRNFLTDVALLDVGKRFVQPAAGATGK